jgi:hypothetical protein
LGNGHGFKRNIRCRAAWMTSSCPSTRVWTATKSCSENRRSAGRVHVRHQARAWARVRAPAWPRDVVRGVEKLPDREQPAQTYEVASACKTPNSIRRGQWNPITLQGTGERGPKKPSVNPVGAP